MAAVWKALGASSGDPRAWSAFTSRPMALRDKRVLAANTDTLPAASLVAGEDVATFRRPQRVPAFNRPPVTRWEMHPPHLDRTLAAWRCRTHPRSYRIGALTYLTGVAPRGGATIVWPGSHLKLGAPKRSGRFPGGADAFAR